jgi:hypothetical protein
MGKREVNMFVQVIQGHVSDAAQVRAQLDRWVEEVAPGAVGWLGSTSGVTDDGMLIALARFESDEAARQNSDRPEQTAWWEQTAALFTDEPVFHNSTSVEVDTAGDPSQAGFVQVMQGRSSDPDRARELMANDPTDWREFRPDILGTVSVGHGGGAARHRENSPTTRSASVARAGSGRAGCSLQPHSLCDLAGLFPPPGTPEQPHGLHAAGVP